MGDRFAAAKRDAGQTETVKRRRMWIALAVINVIVLVAIAVACLTLARRGGGQDGYVAADAGVQSGPSVYGEPGSWASGAGREFWFGVKIGAVWPVGLYERTFEILKGGPEIDRLTPGECLRYAAYPYDLSPYSLFRLAGIVLLTLLIGYLLCWAGARLGLGWMTYAGIVYFIYLVNIAFFVLYLEVTK